MRKYILNYGLIIGSLLCFNIIYTVNMCYNNPDFEGNMLIGYALMVLEFSLVFVGIRHYRNKELDGFITWGKAFLTGSSIVVIAGTVYVVFWLFDYYLFVPDFIDKYTTHVLKVTARDNFSELPAAIVEMADFKQKYQNPLFVILSTYLEVLPVGLLISLISSFILKRKNEIA